MKRWETKRVTGWYRCERGWVRGDRREGMIMEVVQVTTAMCIFEHLHKQRRRFGDLKNNRPSETRSNFCRESIKLEKRNDTRENRD